jgi:FkbM family methyltransferase
VISGGDTYDLLDLGPMLRTRQDLIVAGMSDEADSLLAGIVEFLNSKVSNHMLIAHAKMQDDPAYASQCLLQAMLVIRVYEPYVGRLAQTTQQCLTATARFCSSLGQIEAAAIAGRMASPDFVPFYPISVSCQIGILDGLYQHCFGRRKSGQFVEIGAYDGETFSNTCGLADLGWHGLYIEPMPGSFERCRTRHAGNPAITTLNLAIGATDATAFMVDEGPLTHIQEAPRQDAVEVKIRRLDDVLAEQGIKAGFDLMVVDVEGFEQAVFAGFDLARWHPSVIVIEISEIAPQDAGKAAIAQRLRATGYRLLFQDAINSVFTRLPEAASGPV